MIRIAISAKNAIQQAKITEYIAKDTEIEDDYSVEVFRLMDEVLERIDRGDFPFDLFFLFIDEVGNEFSINLMKRIRENKYNTDIIIMVEKTNIVSEVLQFKVLNCLIEPILFSDFKKVISQYVQDKKDMQKECLTVSIKGKEQLIPLNTVSYFTSNVRKVGAVLINDSREIWFYAKLGEIEEQLLEYGFIRCHQSFLVNGHYIERITGKEICTTYDSFPIGRKYAENVKKQWEELRKRLFETVGRCEFSEIIEDDYDAYDETMIKEATMNYMSKEHTLSKYGMLIGTGGSISNMVFRLYDGEKTILGRDSSKVQIVLHEKHVSREHCIIRYDCNKQVYFIQDLSTNGSYIMGGERIPKKEWTEIKKGTTITLVDDQLSFLLA